jgi:hypothetical protein
MATDYLSPRLKGGKHGMIGQAPRGGHRGVPARGAFLSV